MTGETRRFFQIRFQSRSLVSREHAAGRRRYLHFGGSLPDPSLTMYSAYQSGQFSSR